MTQEEAEAFVWGPWEFNTNASVQIATNRVSQTRAYSRVTGKNWDLLPLRRTGPAAGCRPTASSSGEATTKTTRSGC